MFIRDSLIWFSPSWQTHKIPISWHKTSKTQHFMNYWCVWSWKPVFLHFIRPEYLKNQEKSGNALGKYGEKHVLRKVETQKIRNSGNLSCPILNFSKFRIPDFWESEMMNSWKSWKVEDEEWPEINFPLIKSTTAWIRISFRSQKHETKMW